MPDVSLDHNLTNGAVADADHVMANFNGIVAAVNDLDDANLGSTLAERLGISQSGSVRRGKSIVAAAESTTSTGYALLATPDRVQDVVLPTDGLLLVAFSALFKHHASNGKAAIFLGGNQLKKPAINGAPAVAEVATPTLNAALHYGFLYTDHSSGNGLNINSSGASDSSNAGTGMLLGGAGAGFIPIRADAGTYDVSVRVQAAAGSEFFMKERRLWVVALGF